MFTVNLGLQPMPLLLSSELFPPRHRAPCKGVSRALTSLLIVATLKLFPVLQQQLGLAGCFYLYSGLVLLSLPLIMLVLPETKDLSLTDINKLFL